MRWALAPVVMVAGCASVLPEVEESRERCATVEAVRSPEDPDDQPPLHDAAGLGDLKAARACLEHGADPNGLDRHGATPLFYAAMGGHLDVMKKLIAAGARIDVASADDGRTPLTGAAMEGQIDAVRLLLDRGAAIDALDQGDKTTALHWAAYADRPSEIHDYQELDKPHDTYWIPKNGAPTVALLIARGAKVNAADAKGETPLHLGVNFGALPAVRALLAAGADPTLRDHEGRTPLDVARLRGGNSPAWPPEPFLEGDRREILRLLEEAVASRATRVRR